LLRLEQVLADGLFVAGFLAYEASAAFGLPTRTPTQEGPPLVWFGIYREPFEADPPRDGGAFALGDWQPALEAPSHADALERIQQHIAAGDTYQVNFTFPLGADFSGDPLAFFARLVVAQRPRHAAFVDTGPFAVASASPELFFRRESDRIATRPMKGTSPRGATIEGDERAAAALAASPKERAENLMIVDMLRNDLGRVARFGTVQVPALFEVERYPTLLQMTSTVTAESAAGLAEVVPALFPCASITGAPKRRTMEIIAALEPAPRGVYTGAIGWAAPDGAASFNVAIRTAVVDRDRRRVTFGVGSGVVADSSPEAEYAECLLKARILREPPFALLETLAFTPADGFWLLDEHLSRIQASAGHFGIPVESSSLSRELLRLGATLEGAHKVRLLVDEEGALRLESARLPGPPGRPLRVGMSRVRVDLSSPWLYHKTTRREVYEAALASRNDCDDVLLWNERGELTEGTNANLIVETASGLVTPPVRCGLLAGLFRARLIAEGGVREQVVPAEGLSPGARIFLVSSVRGWREGVFVG
jgi:para-aminobenzoate synthetase / 4-amino-4-deoxychorismate lyase